MDKKKFLKLVKEIFCEQENCCQDKDKYCFFKEFIASSYEDPRILVQFKCIHKFKYEESKHEGKDLEDAAAMRWMTEGYAKRFREVWDENELKDEDDKLGFQELYHLTVDPIREKQNEQLQGRTDESKG
jgi:hypothetical protein